MKAFIQRLVFIYFFVETFTRRHFTFLIGGFVAGFVFTLLVFRFSPVFVGLFSLNKKVIGIIGEYTTDSLPLSVQQLISSGLTTVSQDGTALPSLASSWEATEDGKLYTFHLKPDLVWHDGKQFVSTDVTYALKDATITYPDSKTVKIALKQSFSPLPVVLSRPLLRNNFLGIGLYKVSDVRTREDKLVRISLTPLRDSLPPLEYKFFPSIDDAILAFKLGEINTLVELPSKDPFSSWKHVKIHEVTLYDRFLGVFFNLKNDKFKEKEIRQGLSFAIPAFDGQNRLFTPIAPSSWAYYNKVRLYKYDPENAKKILSKTELASSSSEITLSTYSFYLSTAQKIADSWNAIGIKTKVKVETAFPSDYQAFLVAQEIPRDPDQYQFWHTNAGNTNIAHYSNLKIDKLLEDGRKDTDREKRKKTYADFQRYLVDDAPVSLLFFPKVYTIER